MPTAEEFMQRAIRLSRRGFPAPNPHVGCVIVRDGVIVGEGWHDYAGGPHAEAIALTNAGKRAKGATVYVTLEPCNHTGRTGPCTSALIASEISEVVFACDDPNPRAARGADTLREAGIAAIGGMLAEQARQSNIRFMVAHEQGRPYVVLKSAISLDGRIALPSGESKWITGERSRREAHRLRAEMGCVLVGKGTVARDDPWLMARLPGVKNQPLRVVLDPSGALPSDRKVFSDGLPTIRVVAPGGDGLEVPFERGHFDLSLLLGELWRQGVTGILVEGGALTLQSFLTARLVDRIELFMAPVALGGGPSWLEGGSIGSLSEAPRFKFISSKRLGADIRLSFEPAW